VLLSEFGAYFRVNDTPEVRAARLAWIRSVRSAAEQRSFGWAVWSLLDASGDTAGGFGILPPNEVGGMDLGVVNALGLHAS
jgi:hypothetical protein